MRHGAVATQVAISVHGHGGHGGRAGGPGAGRGLPRLVGEHHPAADVRYGRYWLHSDRGGLHRGLRPAQRHRLRGEKNLALNSGNYAEVLFGTNLTRDQQVKYGSQGILLPLEDLIDRYCPNIQTMFEENDGVRASMTAPDGHIYALGQLATSPPGGRSGKCQMCNLPG